MGHRPDMLRYEHRVLSWCYARLGTVHARTPEQRSLGCYDGNAKRLVFLLRKVTSLMNFR